MTSAAPHSPFESPPEPQTARTIGLLNIVFGALLTLLCLGTLGIGLGMPLLDRFLTELREQQVQKAEERQAKRLADLDQAEQDAQSEQEKVPIRAQRRALERQPFEPMTGMTFGIGLLSDRHVQRYTVIYGATLLLLNLLLVVSGIGLMRLKSWGRHLANWSSGWKIAALLGFGMYYLVAISPIMARSSAQDLRIMILEMLPEDSAEDPALDAELDAGLADYAERVEKLYSVLVGTFIAFGWIYPAIVLWVLQRPRVKAAVQPILNPSTDSVLENLPDGQRT